MVGLSKVASFLTIKDFLNVLEEMENAVWKLGRVIVKCLKSLETNKSEN